MIATLEFSLPDDQEEMARILSCQEAYSALSDIQRYLHDHLKHGEPSEETKKAFEELRLLVPSELLDRVWT